MVSHENLIISTLALNLRITRSSLNADAFFLLGDLCMYCMNVWPSRVVSINLAGKHGASMSGLC